MGWMAKHVQVGDRVAVVDHEAGGAPPPSPGSPRNSRAVQHGPELPPERRMPFRSWADPQLVA
jgi:hypothetical protein